jgi:hypothetical protein
MIMNELGKHLFADAGLTCNQYRNLLVGGAFRVLHNPEKPRMSGNEVLLQHMDQLDVAALRSCLNVPLPTG